MKILHIALDTYEKLIEYIVETDENTILDQVIKSAKYYLGQVDISEGKITFLQGEEDIQDSFARSRNIQHVSDLIQSVKNRKEDYLKVYHMLEDHFSKKTFFFILRTKLLPYDLHSLDAVRCGGYQYFRSELIEAKGQGVLADCGGLDGGSTFDYMDVYGKDLKKSYIFEPHPDHIKVCEKNTATYPNIECINKATGKEKGVLKFDSQLGGASRFMDDGNIEVAVDTLDTMIKEPITFLKMDIEGGELDSLKGARRHIVEDKPYLTICLYHKLEDSIDIPLLIWEMNKEQNFNVRYHSDLDDTYEVVLYVTPRTGQQETDKNLNRFVPSLKGNSYLKKQEDPIVLHQITVDFAQSYKVCFFGAGRMCTNALTYFRENNLPLPVAISDNNQDIHGTSIEGIPVMSLDDILSKWDDCHIILTVGPKYKKDIYHQVLEKVQKERIVEEVNFYNKNNKVILDKYEKL